MYINNHKHHSIAVKNQSNYPESYPFIMNLESWCEICKKETKKAYKIIKSFQHRSIENRKQVFEVERFCLFFFTKKVEIQHVLLQSSTTKCVFYYFKKNFLPENRAFQCQKLMKKLFLSFGLWIKLTNDHAVKLLTGLTGIAISHDQRMCDIMSNFHFRQ